MSWMQRLYQTYDQILQHKLDTSTTPLTPVGHTLQTAHIVITLNQKGEFQTATVMPPKTTIMLPVTEDSENRTSGEAPHPFADKIQYVAKDYLDYGGQKNSYFDGYLTQLQKWCNSSFAHPKVKAILNYVSQGTVMADLIKQGIFHLDNNGHVLNKWENNSTAPAIFATLPKSQEYGAALICWRVEIPNDLNADTWTDRSIQQSWIDYIASSNNNRGFCFIKGQKDVISNMHPAKLRHTGDKAKLISSNDKDGYTFRGRFDDANEAASISNEVSTKAHSALRWLISRQGIRNGDQVTVAWAIDPQTIPPSPLQDNYDYLDDDDDDYEIPSIDDGKNELSNELSTEEHVPKWSINLGQQAAAIIKKKMLGLKAELPQHQQISLLMLDSATPGRMALTYYQEFLPDDYFANLDAWLDDFCWYQRYSRNKKEDKKEDKRTTWPVIPPSPDAIAKTVYGRSLSDTLKKQLYARLLPVIAGGPYIPFPLDLVQKSIESACNPNGYERWEWERNVGVACALYKGWRIREDRRIYYHDSSKWRNYSMALEKENRSRDYLYGRLLAIAENIESYALYLAGEKRTTNAERYMQRFAQHPFSTWRNIELALIPYQERLQNNNKDYGKQDLDEIMDLFKSEDFICDDKLSGEFLLGYHSQKMEIYRKVAELKANKDKSKNETKTDE
ncbi:type I-C CRISPR-associated protein Cas8c/Csd1 [Gallibacterium salpingitidis]|uniref:CRISPR-associated protein Csd1 n=1 Tax=Gallibacterium salpingitidis TaxID=505341 RepID=A0A1A7NWU8_9PAST|nr:type I-C CRISPR-associated protein Cas8c/Csd1 [Gallibacterium salpingitidis]OBW94168.1 CRISPR-associated protein Csd1 [Gallibacterium salpingitidis]